VIFLSRESTLYKEKIEPKKIPSQMHATRRDNLAIILPDLINKIQSQMKEHCFTDFASHLASC
jgi:aminoglycoside/choline kinase family phosphotransferase